MASTAIQAAAPEGCARGLAPWWPTQACVEDIVIRSAVLITGAADTSGVCQPPQRGAPRAGTDQGSQARHSSGAVDVAGGVTRAVRSHIDVEDGPHHQRRRVGLGGAVDGPAYQLGRDSDATNMVLCGHHAEELAVLDRGRNLCVDAGECVEPGIHPASEGPAHSQGRVLARRGCAGRRCRH